MARIRIGGSFAPPLTAEKLAHYKSLAKNAGGQIGDYMAQLAKMLETFRETPDSQQPGTPHPSGRGTIVPLEDAEIERIWDVVPWAEELDVIGKVFDTIPAATQAELRNAAFHLLWFGRELCADREPITNDKL